MSDMFLCKHGFCWKGRSGHRPGSLEDPYSSAHLWPLSLLEVTGLLYCIGSSCCFADSCPCMGFEPGGCVELCNPAPCLVLTTLCFQGWGTVRCVLGKTCAAQVTCSTPPNPRGRNYRTVGLRIPSLNNPAKHAPRESQARTTDGVIRDCNWKDGGFEC